MDEATETESRSLREVLGDLTPSGDLGETRVTGIATHSAAVTPGAMFVAIPGAAADGHEYVHDAVRRGAAAVVLEHDVEDVGVPVIHVSDARRAVAEIAAAWYRHPAREMTLVGITGTFGKTSILSLLEHILTEAGHRTGAIGSEIVGIRLGEDLELQTPHTTPDPLRLHHGLRCLADAGAEVVCMEVTSHALHQERVHGLDYAVGIFSNLAPMEHQDYHLAFEDYVETKLRFCEQIGPEAPLVYGSDNSMLNARLDGNEHELVGCGFDSHGAVVISDVTTGLHGTSLNLAVKKNLPRIDGETASRQSIPIELRLLGRPHILNSALAATAGLILGVEPGVIGRALKGFPPPTRRMELLRIDDFHVLDDTAGHPDSVDAVFEVASDLPYNRLHVVAAIRGQRGEKINAQLARALAAASLDHPPASLTVTDSSEVVDEANEVTPEERQAFLDTLEHHGVDAVYREELRPAIDRAVSQLEPDDLLVLIGAQGMIPGADLVRELLQDEQPAR